MVVRGGTLRTQSKVPNLSNPLQERGGVGKRGLIGELTRSPHGKLEEYLKVGLPGAVEEPEFFGHLVAWNHLKGQVRDSKVALPVVALKSGVVGALEENALAHLALLDPRNLLRAWDFVKEVRPTGKRRAVDRVVEAYLRARESNWAWWERAALQHRESMKALYRVAHIKPNPMADSILFKGQAPNGTVWEGLKRLAGMGTTEAADFIVGKRIPFLVVKGVMGKRLKEEPLMLALMERMSPTELTTNLKLLEGLGVRDHAATRALLDKKLTEAAGSTRTTLKTQKAVKSLGEGVLKERAKGLAEAQVEKNLQVEGDWLVLADKSGSMQTAIQVGRVVAGTLARAVKGKVQLVFFDNLPRALEVTGKSLEEIQELTGLVTPGGGTSIGVGLAWALEKGLEFDGIAIVSDGGEGNHPLFCEVYKKASQVWGKEVPVYFYRLKGGDPDYFSPRCEQTGVEVIRFDVDGMDYYSLPNLVKTMRASKYGLVDEIMEVPLLTLAQALKVERVVGL